MKLKEDIRLVKRPNKTFIFSVQIGDLFEINEIGEVIIKSIKEGKSEEEIVDYLQKETGEKRDTIEKDVKEFIEQLEQKNFLE